MWLVRVWVVDVIYNILPTYWLFPPKAVTTNRKLVTIIISFDWIFLNFEYFLWWLGNSFQWQYPVNLFNLFSVYSQTFLNIDCKLYRFSSVKIFLVTESDMNFDLITAHFILWLVACISLSATNDCNSRTLFIANL